jgi:signal transduction histidine kinase/ligand-binding sensor domain-containing protein
MFRYMIIFVLLALVSANPVSALDTLNVTSPDPILEPWRWTTFDQSNGLKGLVRVMYEDRDGNIWFGTNLGVQKYDGRNWTTFEGGNGPPTGFGVSTILQTQNGDMWFAYGALSSQVLYKFDGENWTHYEMEGGFWRHGLHEARDGTLWAGFFMIQADAPSGIARFDGTTWTTIKLPEKLGRLANFLDIEEDENGALWFSSYQGLFQFDGKNWTKQQVGKNTRTNGMLQAQDGALWVSAPPNEVWRFAKGKWEIFDVGQGLPKDAGYTRNFWQTKGGDIWTGGMQNLSRFGGTKWHHYMLKDLPSRPQNIQGITTRGNMMWLYEFDKNRVHRFDTENAWRYYSHADSLFGGIETVDGSTWFHTHKQAVRYKNGVWLGYTPQDGFLDGVVLTINKTKDGALWFTGTHRGKPAMARYADSTWHIYTEQEGLVDHQATSMARNYSQLGHFIETKSGDVWLLGSYDNKAALARFDGHKWHRHIDEGGQAGQVFGCGIETSDGALWLGSHGATPGLHRYDGKVWQSYPDSIIQYRTGVGEFAEWPKGTLWVGHNTGISKLDIYDPNAKWWHKTDFSVPNPKFGGFFATDNALWFRANPGRRKGVFRYDGEHWYNFGSADGLVTGGVNGINQTGDGLLWFATKDGISCFDGKSWRSYTAGDGIQFEIRGIYSWPIIHTTKNGGLWITDPYAGKVLHFYKPLDKDAPETTIETALDRISSKGNILLKWQGRDLWEDTPHDELKFQWRFGNGEWTLPEERTDITLTSLSDGDYTFKVRAVDRDGNVDSSPSIHAFIVDPPWWKDPLIAGPMVVFFLLMLVQTGRVIQRDRRLNESNHALSDANKELFGLNRELQQERFVERIRGEVQAMEKAEDFDNLLSTLAEDLKAVGLHFTTCGIDVLDEPMDDPTMPHFEMHGFHYTAYTIDPDGIVTRASYRLSAPFPPVNLETIERFIAGEPWQGMSSNTAIVEIPIAQYGRLRLTASERERFVDDEIKTLQDFAAAIALGYTRYLDFVNLETANKEIQIQTERKSAFLASMSHELRTPMNAIIGFTNMVLRRSGDVLPDRQKGNLENVIQASNRLLGLITGLLDLSKIEAGRMDVVVKRFRVETLIRSCCAEVEPLVAEKSDVSLVYEVGDDVDEAKTDEVRVRQMVTNLLSNAIKFTDQGEVAVQVNRETDIIVIAVSDTGAGIPQDSLETIFEEFQQVKGSDTEHKGTGLGLPICKGFAELLGGSISVKSVVGKGSKFTVRVPMVYEAD